MARPAVAEPAADAAVAPSASEFDLMIARHAVVWYPLAAAVVGLVAFVTAVLAMSLDSDYTSLYVWNGRADFGRLLGASLVQAVAVGGVLVAHRWCRARPLWTAALAIFVVVAHVVPALLVAPPWHNRQAWVLGQLTATSVFQAAALLTFRSLTLAWFRLRHGSPGVAASPFEERIREAPVLWAVISLTILGFLVVLTWGLTMLVWGDFTRPYFGFGVRDSPGRVFMATCLQAYAVVLALYALARLRGRGMARVGLILFVLAVHAFFAMGVVSPNEQAPMLGLLLARSIWIGALFLLVLAGLRRMAGAPRGA